MTVTSATLGPLQVGDAIRASLSVCVECGIIVDRTPAQGGLELRNGRTVCVDDLNIQPIEWFGDRERDRNRAFERRAHDA